MIFKLDIGRWRVSAVVSLCVFVKTLRGRFMRIYGGVSEWPAPRLGYGTVPFKHASLPGDLRAGPRQQYRFRLAHSAAVAKTF